MDRGGPVCTVSSPRRDGWWNVRDGRVLCRHKRKEAAIEAGRVIAERLRVPHQIQESHPLLKEG